MNSAQLQLALLQLQLPNISTYKKGEEEGERGMGNEKQNNRHYNHKEVGQQNYRAKQKKSENRQIKKLKIHKQFEN